MNQKQPNMTPLFTVREVAHILRLSTQVVYDRIRNGSISAARIGPSLRVSTDEIARLTGQVSSQL